MSATHERGAGVALSGVLVSLALPTATAPGAPQIPDARHFFVRLPDQDWHLVDMQALCAAQHVRMPFELTDTRWSTDYLAQLHAVARLHAALLRPAPAPASSEPKPEANPGRRWWPDRED